MAATQAHITGPCFTDLGCPVYHKRTITGLSIASAAEYRRIVCKADAIRVTIESRIGI